MKKIMTSSCVLDDVDIKNIIKITENSENKPIHLIGNRIETEINHFVWPKRDFNILLYGAEADSGIRDRGGVTGRGSGT